MRSSQTHYALLPAETSLPSFPKEATSPKDSGIERRQHEHLIYQTWTHTSPARITSYREEECKAA